MVETDYSHLFACRRHSLGLQCAWMNEMVVCSHSFFAPFLLSLVMKGSETVEYACSLPQLAQGRILTVSGGGVECRDRRDPLGVVASVVPFNFPFMVPMWTIPIALVLGNTLVLKPSEKVPLTMHRVASLLADTRCQKGVPSWT